MYSILYVHYTINTVYYTYNKIRRLGESFNGAIKRIKFGIEDVAWRGRQTQMAAHYWNENLAQMWTPYNQNLSCRRN